MNISEEDRNLAIFGGRPAFREALHVGRPNIGNRDRFDELLDGIFQRKWLSNNGPLAQEFEKRIAEYLQVKHCVVVSNATVGLEILIKALELKGEVIVPSFTFVATAHALQWQGITPVFCDIDPETHNLDPGKVTELIGPATSGILGVHVWGRPCAVDELIEIAKRKNVKLLFDAAHAFGCSYNGTMIGNFGEAEVFSFHATKFFNTFEGGAIATNSEELAGRLRLMKNFGFSGYDNVVDLGLNAKMSEVHAAMGIANLESIDDFISVNRKNYLAYKKSFSSLPGIRIIEYPEREKCNYQYVVVEIDETIVGLTRDEILQVLHAENVLARRYFYPGCHQMEPYKKQIKHRREVLQETELLAKCIMILPNGSSIRRDEINCISQVISRAFANRHEIHSMLSRRTRVQSARK
ncbi:MAG: aminotransferase class I/II-fold pyridoxal phosphate-dependent enzyme [Bacteroidia bacterium]|nr:aminotransferase class I/II-fold pyridoxal phosphate-dependent enzyme [Bacteroidia bacterium]